MDLFENLILEAIKSKKLLAVSLRKSKWENRVIGFVSSYDESLCIILNEVNKNGFLIRERKILLRNIFCIEYADNYNNDLEILVEKKIADIKYKERNTTISRHTDLSFFENKVCTFFFNENYVTGTLLRFTEYQLLIKNIGYDGLEDGISCYNRDDLTRIRYGGLNEIRIEILYNSKMI